MIATLPCGFTHENAVYKEVELEEMTGYEEDLLANPNKAKTGNLMTELLARCIVRMGDVEGPAIKSESERHQRVKFWTPYLEKMLINDRTFLFIKLREESVGDDFTFETTCPACHTILPRNSVKLSELKITEMTSTDEEGKEVPRIPSAENELTLPSGKTVTWRHLTGADELFLAKAKKEKADDLLSFLLFRRLLTINDQKVASMASVKALKLADRNAIREAVDATEGGIDKEVEVNCPNCSHAWSFEMPVGQKTFFFPSGLR